MPTYEYGCEACGNTWEVEQRITEDPLKDCPACKKQSAKRLISGGTFLLKGGGWYADGYGNKKSSDSKPAESKPADKSADSKSAGSKPAEASKPSDSTASSTPSKSPG